MERSQISLVDWTSTVVVEDAFLSDHANLAWFSMEEHSKLAKDDSDVQTMSVVEA